MRVEDSRLRSRLKRPLIAVVGVVAVLVVPAWLWFTRGRIVPLSVVLDPPRYVVRSGERIELRPRIRPVRDDVEIRWAGSGVHPDRGGWEAVWQAPAEPGVQHVSFTVRRSGTKVTDRVSFVVTRTDPDKLPLSRPAPGPPPPPEGLAACAGAAPTVKLHGRACDGANLVLEVQGAPPGARSWHFWQGRRDGAAYGQLANLRHDPTGTEMILTSLVAPRPAAGAAPCAWTVSTKVLPDSCSARLDQPVFAAFSWQIKGPGHFRLAAKPARAPGVRFVSYRWSFDDGRERTSKTPQVSHRFEGPPRRFHLVKLEVEATQQGSKERLHATAVRALFDRTVKE